MKADTDYSSDAVIVNVFNFDSLDRRCAPTEFNVCIDGRKILMEADTGCLISCIM